MLDGFAAIVALALRIGVVLALYLFLFLVVRTLRAELVAASRSQEAAADAQSEWLEVVECEGVPALEGKLFPLEAVTHIGRDADNTVMIPDQRVSGRHARLVQRGGQWWIEDLGSTNGTLVNGAPVNGVARFDRHATLQLGPATLRLRSA